jgi:hypothetical protein
MGPAPLYERRTQDMNPAGVDGLFAPETANELLPWELRGPKARSYARHLFN